MVQLFLRTWLEGNIFFGHISDEDGLSIHNPALGDLDISFPVNLHFLAMLRNTFIETWILVASCLEPEKKILGLGSILWWGCALCWACEKLPEYVSAIILLQHSGCVLLVEGCWGLHHCTYSLKMLSAWSTLNTPALLGDEQLLIFLGKMRALQLVAEELLGLSLQLFFPDVTNMVSAIKREHWRLSQLRLWWQGVPADAEAEWRSRKLLNLHAWWQKIVGLEWRSISDGGKNEEEGPWIKSKDLMES